MSTDATKKNVGLLFNSLLTLGLVHFAFVDWLNSPVTEETSGLDSLAATMGDLWAIVIGLLSVVLLFLIGPLIVRGVWNRLGVHLTGGPVISLREAYALFIFLTFVGVF